MSNGGGFDDGREWKMKWGEERWKVGVVYVGERVENVLERIREEMGRIEGETG